MTREKIADIVMSKFSPSRLQPSAIAPYYACPINPMISSQSYSSVPPTVLWVKLEALKRNVVEVVKEVRGEACFQNKDSTEGTITLIESGRCSGMTVAIVNPETRAVCGPYECGEIWISLTFVGYGFAEPLQLSEPGQTETLYHRTGDRGFFWPVPKDPVGDDCCGWVGLTQSGKPYELALFVVSSLEHEIIVHGNRHCLEDLETTVESCYASLIVGGCMIFIHAGSLICAVEITDESKFISASSRIALAVLKQHRLMLDTIAFLKPGMLAKSRLQEKQRLKVAKAYHLGKLPVIHFVHLSNAR